MSVSAESESDSADSSEPDLNSSSGSECVDDACSPILSAAKSGNCELLKTLLDEGEDYQSSDRAGWCVIYYAAFHEHYECVKLILERYRLDYESAAEIVKNFTASTVETPLSVAAVRENVGILELLADLYIESGVNYETMGFPLHVACRFRQNCCLDILLKKMPQYIDEVPQYTNIDKDKEGFLFGFCNFSGCCPLRIAVEGRNLEGAKMLIQYGCDVNREHNSRTLLHLAISEHNCEMVRLLVDKVSDINARDMNDCTPLFLATEANNDEIVRCLLDHGADESERYGGKNKSAVIHAARHGKNDLLKDLFKKGYSTFDSDTKLFGGNVWISILRGCSHDVIQETVEILLDNETMFQSLAKYRERFLCGNMVLVEMYFLSYTFAVLHPDVLTPFLNAGILELHFDCKSFPSVSNIIEKHDNFQESSHQVRSVHKIITCLKYFPFVTWSNGDSSALPTPDNFGDGDLVQNVVSLQNLTRWMIRCLIIKNKGMIHRKYVEGLKLPKKITEFIVKC